MNERELTDKLADALEAICKDAKPAKGLQCGSPQFMRFEIKGRLIDEAQEILAAYRAQRDGERVAAKRCEFYSVTGRHDWVESWTGATKQCRQCRRLFRRPLAKGEA